MAAGEVKSYTSFTRRLPSMVRRFEGQYVAMVRGQVVAHGGDAMQVYERARQKYPRGRIFLGQVPTRQAMVLFLRKGSHSQRSNRRSSAR